MEHWVISQLYDDKFEGIWNEPNMSCLGYHPSICVEETKKFTNSLIWDKETLSQVLNQEP